MDITTEQLRAEVEATATALGITASTVGRRVGQGGRFYARLCEGKRMWPETMESVHRKLQEMRAASPREASHGRDSAPRKGATA